MSVNLRVVRFSFQRRTYFRSLKTELQKTCHAKECKNHPSACPETCRFGNGNYICHKHLGMHTKASWMIAQKLHSLGSHYGEYIDVDIVKDVIQFVQSARQMIRGHEIKYPREANLWWKVYLALDRLLTTRYERIVE